MRRHVQEVALDPAGFVDPGEEIGVAQRQPRRAAQQCDGLQLLRPEARLAAAIEEQHRHHLATGDQRSGEAVPGGGHARPRDRREQGRVREHVQHRSPAFEDSERGLVGLDLDAVAGHAGNVRDVVEVFDHHVPLHPALHAQQHGAVGPAGHGGASDQPGHHRGRVERTGQVQRQVDGHLQPLHGALRREASRRALKGDVGQRREVVDEAALPLAEGPRRRSQGAEHAHGRAAVRQRPAREEGHHPRRPEAAVRRELGRDLGWTRRVRLPLSIG